VTAIEEGVADVVRSRGHWHVIIRPVEFIEERIAWRDLARTVDHVRVSKRGWSVPHHNTRDRLDQDDDWIGQATEWDYHVEVWRLFTSGQFVHLNGLRTDWRDRSGLNPPSDGWQVGGHLGVGEALFSLREYFELAARLALAEPGNDDFSVSIALNGLAGRRLYVDDPNRMAFFEDYVSNSDHFVFEQRLSRTDASTRTVELSVEAADGLFERKFGWSADRKQLVQYLESLWDSM